MTGQDRSGREARLFRVHCRGRGPRLAPRPRLRHPPWSRHRARFVNGLPLAIFELKDASNPRATIWSAFNDHQTKKLDIPSLYAYNEVLVISDGIEARVGSLTADRERFMPWRTISGDEPAPRHLA